MCIYIYVMLYNRYIHVLFYNILQHVVLYCIVLYYTILYYTILYYTMLCYVLFIMLYHSKFYIHTSIHKYSTVYADTCLHRFVYLLHLYSQMNIIHQAKKWIHKYLNTYKHAYIHTYIQTYIQTYIHTCFQASACVYIYMYTFVCVCRGHMCMCIRAHLRTNLLCTVVVRGYCLGAQGLEHQHVSWMLVWSCVDLRFENETRLHDTGLPPRNSAFWPMNPCNHRG